MVGVDDFPLKFQRLHGPVHLAHDVVRLALALDAEMPLAPLDGRAPVCLGRDWGDGLVPEWRQDPLRMGAGRHRVLAQRARGPGEELLEVILLLGGLDPLVVDDEVVGDDKLVVGIITQQGRMYFLFLNSELLTHLERERKKY